MTKHIMLPEKENFLRLRDCDFNSIEEYKFNSSTGYIGESKNSKIPCTLQKKLNPMLVLFYYDTTNKSILTEFFESSFSDNLENGKEEDDIFLNTGDTCFKFGFVNLNLETNILKSFREMNGLNPFSWAKIEGTEKIIAGKKEISYSNYPFIIFYYNSFPQFMYEGLVNANSIKLEFTKWRKELIEMEKKEMSGREEKELKREGYFVALENDRPIKGIEKGKTYWIIVTENTRGIYDYVIKPL